MSASRGTDRRPAGLTMHLSVPAEGSLRELAGELAARIAAHLGAADAEALGARVDGLAAALAGRGGAGERVISFDFRQEAGELIVAARCEGETSEFRHQLGA